jgi:hypothetical protein
MCVSSSVPPVPTSVVPPLPPAGPTSPPAPPLPAAAPPLPAALGAPAAASFPPLPAAAASLPAAAPPLPAAGNAALPAPPLPVATLPAWPEPALGGMAPLRPALLTPAVPIAGVPARPVPALGGTAPLPASATPLLSEALSAPHAARPPRTNANAREMDGARSAINIHPRKQGLRPYAQQSGGNPQRLVRSFFRSAAEGGETGGGEPGRSTVTTRPKGVSAPAHPTREQRGPTTSRRQQISFWALRLRPSAPLRYFSLSSDVDVIAPVIVAALVTGNETVSVFDKPRRQPMSQKS